MSSLIDTKTNNNKLRKFIKRSIQGGVILTSLTIFSSTSAVADTFDAADDFSPTNNPNGAWQYGYSTSLGGTFIAYTNNDSFYDPQSGLEVWRTTTENQFLNVVYNSTNNSVVAGTQNWEPRQLTFHPGPNGEFSIVRWTAPETSHYSLMSSFVGADDLSGDTTTTDVYVLVNGSLSFSESINGFGEPSSKSYSGSFFLHAEDTIDFLVGFGSDNSFANDMTGIDATIEQSVPEPTSILSLSALGMLGITLTFKRKYKS